MSRLLPTPLASVYLWRPVEQVATLMSRLAIKKTEKKNSVNFEGNTVPGSHINSIFSTTGLC